MLHDLGKLQQCNLVTMDELSDCYRTQTIMKM